jgi:hypothetical protein
VERHPDASLLAHRQHAVQVPVVVRPQLVFRVDAVVRELGLLRLLDVECRRCGAPTDQRVHGGAPDAVRHEVVAEHRDAGAAHVAHRRVHVLKLLLPPWEPQHDLVVEADGDVLQADQPQPRLFRSLAEGEQVLVLPALFAGKCGRVEQHVVAAALLDEQELLVRELPELPESDAHGKGVEIVHGCFYEQLAGW